MRRGGSAQHDSAAPRSYQRLVAVLLDPGELTREELLGAAAVLLVLAAAMFGPRIEHGGFAYDDWSIAAGFQRYGLFGYVHRLFLVENTRPLQGPYAAIYAAVGVHQRALLLWAAATRVTVSVVLYVLLRKIGVEALGAIAIAALSLLMPASDALWLWGNGAVVSVAVILYLLGSVAVISAFQSSARARALHVIGLVLYLMSVLLYEIAAVAILASIALYLVRAPRRVAVRRWLLDVTCTGLVLLLVTSGKIHLLPGAEAHTSIPVSQWPSHLRMILEQGASLLAFSAVPFGSPSTVAVCAGLVVLALAGAYASRLPSYGSAPRRWVGIGIAGIGLALAGWAPLIPAVTYYAPGLLGVGNRINGLSAVGLAITVYAAANLLGLLVLGARSRAWAACLGVVATAVVFAGYVRRDDADRAAWNSATAVSEGELGDIRAALVTPLRHNSTIFLFGGVAYSAPGVPVFAAAWDLNGAVQVMWHDSSLAGVPMLPGQTIVCGKRGLYPSGNGFGVLQGARYGRAIFVDIPRAAKATSATISSASQCGSVTRQLLPG